MTDHVEKERLCDLLREVVEGDETVIDVMRDTIGEGDAKSPRTTVVVQRRKCQPEPPVAPDRAESRRRSHMFHGAEGFAAYLSQYGTKGKVVVLANVPKGEMRAILDEDAVHGREVVSFVPQVGPLFKPWLELLGKTVLVKDFAKFVMANRRAVASPDSRELVATLRQVHASIKTEIAQGVGSGAVNGIMVVNKIQGKDKTEPVDIPDSIGIEVPLYVGTPSIPVEIDLLVMADRDQGVTVSLSASMVLQAQLEAFKKMVATVKSGIEDATVVLGASAYDDWAYVK